MSLFAQDVTVRQALELLTATTDTFYVQIGPNTLLVSPETAQKRAQYDEFLIRTFYLRVIRAEDMATIVKGVLNPKQLVVSDGLNSIMVRDTAGVLDMVENLIRANDLRPAELILDVEILEINRNKTEQLGIDYGSRISLNFPQNERSLRQALAGGTLTLPAMSLQYLKQDVDARTLANPKVRVVHGSSAKIHIGDRVPLRSSTVQDATGQVRTTFEYRDVGIRLSVEPHIHLDNSVSVKLGLEVSSLGQNLGTQNEPAFSIGTRNAETQMLMRDGETAVLGGLIRDEDRNSVASLPGLGSIPGLGRLFRVDDRTAGTTDVLLTITPHVVRSWDLPERSAREMYSGTERRYSNGRLFGALSASGLAQHRPVISIGSTLAGQVDQEPVALTPEQKLAARRGNEEVGSTSTQTRFPEASAPRLAFAESLYKTGSGEEVSVDLVYSGPAREGQVEFHVLYNPRIIQFLSVDSVAGSLDVSLASEGTVVVVTSGFEDSTVENGSVIGQLKMKGQTAGSSYLAFRLPTPEGSAEILSIETSSARVQVE